MKSSIVILGGAAVALAAGIAWWLHQTRSARDFDSAAALVKLSRSGMTVSVSMDHVEAGESVALAELVGHLRNAQKLRPGARIGIVVFDSNMEAEVEPVRSQLIDAGFKVAGVMKVGFITEPAGDR
jgi:hypothetical protein